MFRDCKSGNGGDSHNNHLLLFSTIPSYLHVRSFNSSKVAKDLSSKVKLLEDFIQSRTGGPDTIQERGVFEAPSLTAGSEISEVDEQVPVGKVGLPLVPSAAQMRSLRKGSNDQLAITIDSESDRLLDKGATVEDKGHMFKSLNTSGLVPVQGKMIADRLDGIWVSGGTQSYFPNK
nr:polyamine-modulated factor 1-binding protein 1 [Tanacetum cinerariifolium]